MGSLGSKTIINILKKFIFVCDDTIIYHIVTGKGLYNELKELNDKNNIKIYEYIDDMISFMKKCDLVVTRSGATTISEIITIGIPSILIPSPYVVNNHQYLNAKYLLDNNACLLIEEKNLNENVLNSKINYLLNNSNLRINMRINALKLAVFDSNSRFYKLINEVIKIEQ
jgi:UDP-N-acetylglucosamine--N-acetylmuramyl-(pentapeptide) pyrophosphoryl-undecaprenol N-acetylglucosamine transferase